LSAKDLLAQGLIWRVGDGNSINVWGDRWLPTPTSFSVQSPVNHLPLDAKVSALIDREARGWNHTLIQEVFSPEEAATITSIPLCPAFPLDRIIWKGTSTGMFSVRSAYHLGMDIQRRLRGEPSNPVIKSLLWKNIWAVKVPNPVKLFLWKACHNLIPTKVNLFRRRVVEDKSCPCCKREDESIIHAIWTCPGAQDVWGCEPVQFQKCSTQVQDFTLLLEQLMQKLDMEHLCLVAIVARRIWLRRNLLVFEGKFTPPNIVFDEAKLECGEYHRCNILDPPTSTVEGSGPSDILLWQPPPHGRLKANWDESIHRRAGCIGFGCIVRDSSGGVMGAACKYQKVIVEPKMAEVMAALFAISFCREVGFFEVMFEGDVLQVVQEINTGNPPLSRIGHFVESIKKELEGFRFSSVSYCRREVNCVAHELAKEASSKGIDEVWLEEWPNFISEVVCRDFCIS
jgi:hypothetical protein